MNLTRRTLLLSSGAAALGLSYPTLFEPRWLEVTRTRVPLGLRAPVRILHLTDLHASRFVPYSVIEHAIALGLAQKPDIVCLTGDFITARNGYDEARYVPIMRRLSAAVPTYATFGNHDGGRWAATRHGYEDTKAVARMLDSAAIEVLYNRAVPLTIRDQRITLAGVGDLWSDGIDPSRAFREVRGGAPVVLMSHNPDSKEALGSAPWNLMLCGHTHGGQVILPWHGTEFAPVEDKRFVAGLNPWDGRQIYTSRGVGSFFGVRFRCRPEVTVLDLV